MGQLLVLGSMTGRTANTNKWLPFRRDLGGKEALATLLRGQKASTSAIMLGCIFAPA